MATPPVVGGYVWRQHLAAARASNRRARLAIERLLDGRAGSTAQALMLAELASAIGDNLAAIDELATITVMVRQARRVCEFGAGLGGEWVNFLGGGWGGQWVMRCD